MKNQNKKTRSTESKMNAVDAEAQILLNAVKDVRARYGDKVLGWKKQSKREVKAANNALFLKILDEVIGTKPSKIAKVKAPVRSVKELLAVYPMGDPHIGMYAWAEEAGEAFDLSIAERNLCAAIDDLVERTPAAETGLLVNVGDFFHADNMDNQTMRSGHALDVDTRYARVVQCGIRIQQYIIEKLLAKHKRVHVINEMGNHDDHTAITLNLTMKGMFRFNPRVTFDDSPAKFHYFEFGKTLIGVTHGDTCKPLNLPGLMAVDRAEQWGRTRFRYWLTGHIHHSRTWELPGCIVESFRTLAPRDAWHAAAGYRAGRDMQSIVYDREFGEIERRRADISLIEARAARKPTKEKRSR